MPVESIMDDTQDLSGNDKDLVQDVGDNTGEDSSSNATSSVEEQDQGGQDGLPIGVKERLGRQEKRHKREMREMQARMAELQAQISPQHPQSFDANPYATEGSYNPGGVEETISKAVSYALAQRDMEERKAKAAEAGASISKHYQNLQQHLDTLSDKYDDFDDVVRSDHAPFTATMRDAALMLPKKGPGSAGEVLYKLGKNPEELSRIAKLYPHEQAAELVALSHALISGGEQKGSAPRPLGTIKNNPVVNSAGVTEKTPTSQIRALMKAGKFK
jgi:hypothetical protein